MEIIIIGSGDIGFQLTKRLSQEQHNITIIEPNPKKAQRAREQLDAIVLEENGSSYETLKKAGLHSTDILAALTNNDEVNLMACKMAKKVGVRTTIARVRSFEYQSPDFVLSLEDLGCDMIIQPEKATADSVVRLINQASATDIIEFDEGKIQFTGIRLDMNAKVLNTKLKDLGNIYGNPPMRIVALKRGQRTIIPRGDDVLKKGDQIFIICAPNFLEDALKYFGKTGQKTENIMIIGGGLVGGFIAQKLEKQINIKIIESDEQKANILADLLDDTLVIHGDGSDLDLLTFENLQEMDEFIAVTSDDETNIITSLIARHIKVPRTVTLVKKNDYMPLAPTLGLDSVVSKQHITVNEIVRFIRRRIVAQYVELPGMDADIVEYIANEKSKITRKKLMDITFPINSIVGAVLNSQGELVIPTGITQIHPGDRVVVFMHQKVKKSVEKLF